MSKACEGCGYVIGRDGWCELIVREPGEEERTFYFHLPQKEDENRSWGSSHCMAYWMGATRARDYSDAQKSAKELGFDVRRRPDEREKDETDRVLDQLRYPLRGIVSELLKRGAKGDS